MPKRGVPALGLAIRKARVARNWSQETLAKKAGTTRQTIFTLESEGRGTIDTLADVSRALELRALPLGRGRPLAVSDESAEAILEVIDREEIASLMTSIVTNAARARRMLNGGAAARVHDRNAVSGDEFDALLDDVGAVDSLVGGSRTGVAVRVPNGEAGKTPKQAAATSNSKRRSNT